MITSNQSFVFYVIYEVFHSSLLNHFFVHQPLANWDQRKCFFISLNIVPNNNFTFELYLDNTSFVCITVIFIVKFEGFKQTYILGLRIWMTQINLMNGECDITFKSDQVYDKKIFHITVHLKV